MADKKTTLKVDTSELDEAIVKAKILNEELEKARSIIHDLASGKNSGFNNVKSIPDISIEFNNCDESKIKELSEEVLTKVRSLLRQS